MGVAEFGCEPAADAGPVREAEDGAGAVGEDDAEVEAGDRSVNVAEDEHGPGVETDVESVNNVGAEVGVGAGVGPMAVAELGLAVSAYEPNYKLSSEAVA